MCAFVPARSAHKESPLPECTQGIACARRFVQRAQPRPPASSIPLRCQHPHSLLRTPCLHPPLPSLRRPSTSATSRGPGPGSCSGSTRAPGRCGACVAAPSNPRVLLDLTERAREGEGPDEARGWGTGRPSLGRPPWSPFTGPLGKPGEVATWGNFCKQACSIPTYAQAHRPTPPHPNPCYPTPTPAHNLFLPAPGAAPQPRRPQRPAGGVDRRRAAHA